jgi:hypothetical protein
MDIKNYMSLERLKQYDALLKQKMANDNSDTLKSAKNHSDANLETSKTYTDAAVAQKSQVQFVIWEEND